MNRYSSGDLFNIGFFTGLGFAVATLIIGVLIGAVAFAASLLA